jgi:hypothetical protein
VYERRVKERWSQYLPLVQRTLNYGIGSIGTMTARVILGDLAESDLVMDLSQGWADLICGRLLDQIPRDSGNTRQENPKLSETQPEETKENCWRNHS